VHEQHIEKKPGNQVPKLAWPTPHIQEVPYDDHYRELYRQALEDEPAATTTVDVTSPHEIDENGAIIVPMPLPTHSEIEELRALSRDKNHTHDARRHFGQNCK
jgi:hypothetical protein